MRNILFILIIATLAKLELVSELNDSSIEESIAHNKVLIVMFYAPWCGHSKAFMPEFDKLALNTSQKGYTFAIIDATANQLSSIKYKIPGYPTIILYYDGDSILYTKERTFQELREWIDHIIQYTYDVIAKESDLEALKDSTTPCLVAVCMGNDNESMNLLKSVVRHIDGILGYVFKIRSIPYSVNKIPSFVLLKNYDKQLTIYEGDHELYKIIEFVKQKSQKIISIFNKEVANEIFINGENALFLFSKESQWDSFKNDYYVLASKYHRDLLFTLSFIKDGIQEKLANMIGLKEEELPLVLIMSDTKNTSLKYKLKIVNPESVEEFILQWKDNKLAPFYKSEPISSQNNGSVYKLVGANFKQIVKDDAKDVIVMFYTSWCSHCRTLSPIYHSVADRINDAGNKNMLLAEIDCSLNEIEGVNIKEFPTLRMYKKRDKPHPIEFVGNYTEEEVVAFIQNKSSIYLNIKMSTNLTTDAGTKIDL